MIILIHGPAELLRTEALAQVRAAISEDAEMVDLNTTRLEGRQASVADLQNACDILPFLTERRLVIVDEMLRRQAGQSTGHVSSNATADGENGAEEPPAQAHAGQGQALSAYLDQVPQSTDLVFLESELVTGGAVWRRLSELRRQGLASIVTCTNPKRNDLQDWIRERAAMRRVSLDGLAVMDLAEFVGDDLRQIDQELLKFHDYAGSQRAVTRADVRRLVAATRAANVFEMVDALGLGEATTAGRLLQHLLDIEGEPPLRLLGMIARQYRLLIQAKSLQAQGTRPDEIARQLGLPDWTVQKLLKQASRHNFSRLERSMESILAADESIKTGRSGDREAMDLLLAQLLER